MNDDELKEYIIQMWVQMKSQDRQELSCELIRLMVPRLTTKQLHEVAVKSLGIVRED